MNDQMPELRHMMMMNDDDIESYLHRRYVHYNYTNDDYEIYDETVVI